MAEFVTVGQLAKVPPGKALQVQVNGQKIGLWNVNGTIYALGDICTHEECDLTDGGEVVMGDRLECPCHGAQFNVRTGAVLALPAPDALPAYPVQIVGDDIQIAV